MFNIIHFSPGSHELYSHKSWIMDYSIWIKDIIRLDFGKTLTGEPVLKEILLKGKNSAFLIALALLTSIIFTLFLLIITSKIKYRACGELFWSTGYAISVIPMFILGYFFLHISRHKLISSHVSLDDPSWVYYLIPGLILGISDGALSECMRHAQVEIETIKNENYIRMAIAKGARLWHHIKNDLIIHMSKVLSIHLVLLISGTVFIEYIFCLPGIGSLAFNAAENRDVRLLLGILILTIFVITLVNLINRLVMLILDPRLR